MHVNKADIAEADQLIEVIRRAYESIQSGGESRTSELQLISEPFTDLQLELMRLISLGKSNAAIAAARFTTLKSTENAIARLAKKLNIPSDDTNNQRVLIARAFFRLNSSSKIHE